MMTHMVMNGRIPQRFGDDDEIIGETSNMVETSSSSSSLTAAAAEEEAKGSAPVVQVSIGQQKQQKQQQQQQQQQEEDPNPSSRRSGSPTRGVKKVPSLRRGAAAYAQLLQSAVKASIETARKDLTGDDDDNNDDDQPPTIPPPPSPYYDGGDDITMDVDFEGGRGSSVYNSPTRGNKRRAYEQEEDTDGSYRYFTSNIPNRRRRPSSEMEVEED